MVFRAFLLTLCLVPGTCALAGDRPKVDENFMLVVRETTGADKAILELVPFGPRKVVLDNGEVATFENAWFDLIGDMHVRFVMDGEHTMRNLTLDEFNDLGLTPEQAVDAAVANIKGRYGSPRAVEWHDGIQAVAAESPDLDSSYFLDRRFWNGLLAQHPEGLVVGVPHRGVLLFAPVTRPEAVSVLETTIGALHDRSGSLRVSSALYLFKDGGWTVYRRPAPEA